MSYSIKKNDTVLVLAGKDKGKIGKVMSVNRKDGRVIVEGVNFIKKTKKARSAQDTSGILTQNGPIDISNVQIVCGACGKATRVETRFVEVDGKQVKKRFCKKCGADLDEAMVSAKKTVKKATKKAKTEEADK